MGVYYRAQWGIFLSTLSVETNDTDPAWGWLWIPESLEASVAGSSQPQLPSLSCYQQVISLCVTKFKFPGRSIMGLAFDTAYKLWAINWLRDGPFILRSVFILWREWKAGTSGPPLTWQNPWAGVTSLRKWNGRKALPWKYVWYTWRLEELSKRGQDECFSGLFEGKERWKNEAVQCDDVLMSHNDFTQISQAGSLEPLDKDVSAPENMESRFLYLMTA